MSFVGNKLNEKNVPDQIGVIICNLGTPKSYKYKDVRNFLKEFLSDGRVIEIPKIIWWFILYIFILSLRPFKSGKLYKSVWTKEGSPLMVYSKKLVNKLNIKAPSHIKYELAMRYGQPNMDKALLSLRKKKCDKIIIIPSFPQYSGTTSGSVFDAVSKILTKWRWVPSIIFVNGYHKDNFYIEALSKTLKDNIKKNKPDKIIFSYHGIPKRNIDKGDPYHFFCRQTTDLVVKKLNLLKKDYITSFQSRFGPAEWLKPYTSDIMRSLPKKGIKNILVIAPGFSADCLETIEEIDEENKDIFIDSGGEKFVYVPCLNDSDLQVNIFNEIVKRHSSAW